MTNSSNDRLDRIEAILESVAERQNALTERQNALAEKQDRFQEQLERSHAEMDANHEYIGSELGQLTKGIADLRQSVATMAQVAEQDRNQAAIDRANFQSTVERLLEVLVERFTTNGHG